jgi:hypothetical protein
MNVSALMRFERGATPHPWLCSYWRLPGTNKANPTSAIAD